ncbi:MAG: hypothetical protein KDA60_03080 [Planctomycetales bacterium]|nr:hypothetical protein [Planctomycetales bacterium]
MTPHRRLCTLSAFVLLGLAIANVLPADETPGRFVYMFQSGPTPGDGFIWFDSVEDDNYIVGYSDYDGQLGIENYTNNIVMVGSNYQGAQNATRIQGDALWGNPRSAAQAGECFPNGCFANSLYLHFYDAEQYAYDADLPFEFPTQVAFDFAWTSSEVIQPGPSPPPIESVEL